MICHKDFQRMMLDAEIYVDRIADTLFLPFLITTRILIDKNDYNDYNGD